MIQSYKQWGGAHKFWGLNINHASDLSDFNNTDFIDNIVTKSNIGPMDQAERERLLRQVSLMTWAFVRLMKCHLSLPDKGEEDYVNDIKSRLSHNNTEALIGDTHHPNRAL